MVVLVGDAGVPVTNSEHAVCQLRYRARGRALRRPRCWDQPGACSRRQGSRDTRHHHRHRTCPSRWVLGSRLQCGPHLRRLSRGHEWGCPLVTSLPGSVPRSGPHGAPSCRLLGHLGMGGGLMLPTEAEQDPTTGGPGSWGRGQAWELARPLHRPHPQPRGPCQGDASAVPVFRADSVSEADASRTLCTAPFRGRPAPSPAPLAFVGT